MFNQLKFVELTHTINEKQYHNMDKQGVMHFPGFSAEAAKLLIERRIAGIGIDTLSLDPGNSKDYPVHQLILGAGMYQLENLSNLQQLPAAGSYIAALPMKIKDAPEAPARVIGFTASEN